VLDFGIAKILETEGPDPELTAPNLIIGTPQYMSPEQCSQASGIDARSDIYSLGVILYEMLVGHVPFTGESATAIMLKHLQEPPPSVLDERKDLPPAVGQVIARALSKLPEERYESAGELAEALASAAEDASGMAVAAGGGTTSENAQLDAGNTNRIVVPTAPLEARHTTSEEQDEATIVHAREQSYVADEPELFEMPPPVASFNPWRIMIPAAVLLVVLLGAFFAFQRNSDSSATNDNSQPLVADPNASPVQPGASPTGAGESNIAPASGAPTPATTPAQTTTGAGGTTVNPNPSAETTPTPSPERDDPQNTNTPQEEDDPEPTPSATPRRSATPPARTPTPDDPPPPSPRATPPPAELSSPAADPPPVSNRL
jgi:serine/threonine-protein kinase